MRDKFEEKMNKLIINRTNKKTSLIELKRYFELLYIFSILTILLALFALNRMCYGIVNRGVCFGSEHYFIRNIIEHFFTGLYIPIFSLFIFYTGVLITAKLSSQSFKFDKNKELFVAGF